MRLIDKRYSGIAKGVGTATILGRVHSADISIGNANMSCSFTVMEGKDVDLLLGLDMLKRFQAVIDLRTNRLVFGDGNEVEFLGEAEIPKYMEEAVASEPTVSGPNGTRIGQETGTVTQSGEASSSGSNGAFKGSGQTLGAGSGNAKAPTAPAAAAAANGPSPSAIPAAASAGRPAPPAAQGHSKESIDQLVSLGFSQQQAVAALDACGGNVEYAAGLLFQG